MFPEKDTSRLPLLRLRFPMLKGDAVLLLQRRLNYHGIKTPEDSEFGYGVAKAIRQFQGKHGMATTGTCDAETWEKLLADK